MGARLGLLPPLGGGGERPSDEQRTGTGQGTHRPARGGQGESRPPAPHPAAEGELAGRQDVRLIARYLPEAVAALEKHERQRERERAEEARAAREREQRERKAKEKELLK